MVYAAAEPERDQLRIAANVNWLESAQIKAGDPVPWPGTWTYSSSKRTQPGDNSNTQYALLGLNAAAEAGVPVKPEVWALSRPYWEQEPEGDGSWAYTPDTATVVGQHDLRGNLQPDHHRTEAVPGSRVPPGRR